MKEKAILLVCVLVAILCPSAIGKIIYVDEDGPADFNNIKAKEMPSAFELLDRYAANQDKVVSFIVKLELVASVKETNEENPNFSRRIQEIRFDGKKSHIIDHQWLDLPSRDAITSDNERIFYLLWDGDINMVYRVGLRADIDRDEKSGKHSLRAVLSSAALFGIWYNYDERLDKELRKIETISVRDKLEQVGSEDCFVIDANSTTSNYTVWFDPQHGYQIAQAEIHLSPGSRCQNRLLDEDESRLFSIRNIHFENTDGIWIPIETDIHEEIINSEPDKSLIIDEHYNIKEIILNPDHEALGSFEPVIENGTTVIDRDKGIKYTWQDGKLIPEEEEK